MRAVSGSGADDFTDIFNPKPVGEPINSHVHESVREPATDFEAMRRFVEALDYRKIFTD